MIAPLDRPPAYTVAICTLNESGNIQRVLDSIDGDHLEEILVVDGGSTDDTVEIAARDPRVRLIGPVSGRLLRQRLVSARESKTDLVAFVDADDSLHPGALDLAHSELLDGGLDGVQFAVRSRVNQTWWQRGWDVYCQLLYRPGEEVPMLGRPCMTWTRLVAEVPLPDGHETSNVNLAEDNFIHAFQKATFGRLNYRISGAQSLRLFPGGAAENLKKWYSYGKGDSATVASHGGAAKMAWHQLGRCGLERGFRSVALSQGAHVAFFLVYGLTRHLDFLQGMTARTIQGVKFSTRHRFLR